MGLRARLTQLPANESADDRVLRVTLIEILVASAVALVVALGIGTMDVGRLRMENEVRSRTGVTSEQEKVALAALSLSKALERADRINIRNTGINGNLPFNAPPNRGDIQIRTFEPDTECPAIGAGCPIVCTNCTGPLPPPCCFDIPGNYRWDEYKRLGPPGAPAVANVIWLYRDAAAGCVRRVLAGEASQMTVTFQDEAPPPPGGDPLVGGPAGSDNNTIAYKIRWDDGAGRTRDFNGQVTSRAIPYSNIKAAINAQGANSGWGQATGAVDPSEPPAACP